MWGRILPDCVFCGSLCLPFVFFCILMRARARLCVCVCVLARQSSTESRKIAVGDGRASRGWFLAYKERLGTQGPRPGRQKTYELRRTMALEMPLAVLKRRTPGGWCLPVLLRKTGKNARKVALLSAFLRYCP